MSLCSPRERLSPGPGGLAHWHSPDLLFHRGKRQRACSLSRHTDTMPATCLKGTSSVQTKGNYHCFSGVTPKSPAQW